MENKIKVVCPCCGQTFYVGVDVEVCLLYDDIYIKATNEQLSNCGIEIGRKEDDR